MQDDRLVRMTLQITQDDVFLFSLAYLHRQDLAVDGFIRELVGELVMAQRDRHRIGFSAINYGRNQVALSQAAARTFPQVRTYFGM